MTPLNSVCPDSPAPLPTAQQIGDRVLRCKIIPFNDGLPSIVETPDEHQVVTAAMLLVYLGAPL